MGKMKRPLFLFCILYATTFSLTINGDTVRVGRRPETHRRVTPHLIRDSKEGNANSRADLALQVVETAMLWEEPVVVSNMSGPCSSCSFAGMLRLNRTGPATSIDLDDERRRLKLGLYFPAINSTCNCTFAYILSGKVDIQIQDFVMYLDIIVDFDTEETEVRTIKIVDPGRVSSTFDGYGILGNIIDKFNWLFQGMINRRVTSMVKVMVPKILQTEKRDRLFTVGTI